MLKQISVFHKYFIFYYNKYRFITIITITLLCTNVLYYIYWLYYIISIFNFHNNKISCTDYYNDNLSTSLYHNIPSIDINISLFDIQSNILYIIIWSIIMIAPYFIFSFNKYKSILYYNINIILGLYTIIIMIHMLYIPNIIMYNYEYYQIYQTRHESLNINIEYNLIQLIRQIVYLIVAYSVIVIITTTNIKRSIIICLYILMMPWDQPTMVIIISIIGVITTIEIINIIYIATINYLAKIAGLCTDAHI